MGIRIIEVERCGVGNCPFCIPHQSNEAINYCGAFVVCQYEISAKVKTFPLICPLEEKD